MKKRRRHLLMDEVWDIEDIVERVQHGDEDAFEELVRKYEKLIYYIVMPCVSNPADAKDIVQETLIEVRKSICKLKEPRYFKAWLNKIAYSKISRHYEKHKDKNLNVNDEANLYKQMETRYYMDPQQSFRYQNDREILNDCLQKLKKIYREVLVLQYLEGYSMMEMAEILDVPIGTVKSRCNVAKKELRKVVEQMEQEDQIHLDFHSAGMEILAAMLGYEAMEQIPTNVQKKKTFFSQFQGHVWLMASLAITIGISTVAGVSALSNIINKNRTGLTQTETIEPKREEKTYPFPEVFYQGNTVMNARDAYGILYDNAFGISKGNPEEVVHIYNVLLQYGGHYSDMAKHLEEYLNL